MAGRRLALLLSLAACTALSGCAVVSVAGTVVSVGAGAVGLAADAAIGTARLTGKAVGAVIGAGSDDDNSGVSVRFREPTEADHAKRRMAEQQAEEEDRRAAQERESPR